MKLRNILMSAAAIGVLAGSPALARTKTSTPSSTPSSESAAPLDNSAPASTPQASTSTTPSSDAATASTTTGATGTANSAGTTATAGAATGSKVAVGAMVKDTNGQPVGKIEAVEGDVATVATATSNSKVRIPVSSFGSDTSGPVLAMTASQLDAAAKAAAPAGKPQPTTGSN